MLNFLIFWTLFQCKYQATALCKLFQIEYSQSLLVQSFGFKSSKQKHIAIFVSIPKNIQYSLPIWNMWCIPSKYSKFVKYCSDFNINAPLWTVPNRIFIIPRLFRVWIWKGGGMEGVCKSDYAFTEFYHPHHHHHICYKILGI